MRKTKIRPFKAVVVSLFVLLVMAAGYYFYQAGCSFRTNAEKLVKATEALSERAADFDQNSVLAGLPTNTLNFFCYRLDDALDKAVFEKLSGGQGTVGSSCIFSLEFDGQDNVFFRSAQGEIKPDGGFLKIGPTRKEVLESVGTVDIPVADISKIVIRLRALKDNLMWLGFSGDPSVERTDLARMQLVPFDVIPDGSFHTYEIPVRDILRGKIAGAQIRRIFLAPAPNVFEDYVEIDYLRFVSANSEFRQRQYGITYEKGGNLLQPAAFMVTPAQLTYRLTLPAKQCWLSFSTKILEDNDSVTFSINAGHLNRTKRIFSHQMSSTDQWREALLDLSAYAGTTVDLVFRAESRGGNVAFWGNPIVYSLPEKRFNVVIVLEDALRADHMSCYGYHRKTTPVKDEWKDLGVLFLNSYAQATVTSPSVRSLMTSLYPTATGIWGYEPLHQNFLTLAEVLRSQGFITASFLQNPNAGASAGLQQGFCQVFDPVPGRAEEMYKNKVPAWLKSHGDRNFFIYMHLIDPHGVYDPPEKFRKWYKPPQNKGSLLRKDDFFDPGWVKNPTTEGRRALYDGELCMNDYYFKNFLDQIREMGLFEDTLIFFIADHGEHLGEHNEWGHHPPGYVRAIKTPMIAVYPHLFPKGLQLPQLVQNLDIMPTILDLLHIDTSGMLLQGKSLLPLIQGKSTTDRDNRIILSDEVVTRRSKNDLRPMGSIFYRSKHILISPDVGLRRFDLAADAAEEEPERLAGKEENLYRASLLQIQESNARLGDEIAKGKEAPLTVDPETVNRLKQLGYLGGGSPSQGMGTSSRNW